MLDDERERLAAQAPPVVGAPQRDVERRVPVVAIELLAQQDDADRGALELDDECLGGRVLEQVGSRAGAVGGAPPALDLRLGEQLDDLVEVGLSRRAEPQALASQDRHVSRRYAICKERCSLQDFFLIQRRPPTRRVAVISGYGERGTRSGRIGRGGESPVLPA